MTVHSTELDVQTRGDGDTMDVTELVKRQTALSGVDSGIVLVSVVGSTAAVTTIEYEPGLVADLAGAWERVAPAGIAYEHDKRWGDGNGHSHVRAAILGHSTSIALIHGELALGTWQQVVLVDFDTRPRTRRIVVQVLGE